MTSKEKALLHIYPTLAGLPEVERRDMLQRSAGVVSATDPGLSQEGFERAMAAYELVLWERVDRKICRDPRACRVCGRVMRSTQGGYGACPEGCETRKVYAWSRDYWRKKLPAANHANSRLIYKIRQLWAMLRDYLPEGERDDRYLAGIIAQAQPARIATERGAESLLDAAGNLAFERLTMAQSLLAIEALKDRLRYAVR